MSNPEINTHSDETQLAKTGKSQVSEHGFKKKGREKEYMRECQKKRRAKNPQLSDVISNIRLTEIRRRIKDHLVKWKGGQCNECGKVYPSEVFDFHHINPDLKNFNISTEMLKKTVDELHEELENCVLLCSNCHRITHRNILENNNTDYFDGTSKINKQFSILDYNVKQKRRMHKRLREKRLKEHHDKFRKELRLKKENQTKTN